MFIEDTHPDAQRVREQVLMRMSGPERLAVADELTLLTRSKARAALRQQMPNASPDEFERAYFELVLGEELAAKVLAYRDSIRAGSNPTP
jgi:hypothetical protein